MKVKKRCPKCLSFNLTRFGKDPKTGKQKYRCKDCKYQFVEGKIPSKTRDLNLGICSKCGKKLHLRKRNKNTLQIRCSDRINCRYSFSYVHRDFKRFLEEAENEDFFKIPKYFKYPVSLVFKALKMYFVYKLSLRAIKRELSLVYPKAPSPTTILKWIRKCGYFFSLLSSNKFVEVKNPSKIWLIDDSVVRIKGRKFRLFVVLGYSERVVLAWYLSPTKDKEAVKKVLMLALQFNKEKPSCIVSDFAQNIQEAVREVFKDSVFIFRVRLFKRRDCFSNNRLERFFSTIKERFKLRKQPKSFLSAKLQILIIIALYNLSPHNSIKEAPLRMIAQIKNIPYYVEGVIKCFV